MRGIPAVWVLVVLVVAPARGAVQSARQPNSIFWPVAATLDSSTPCFDDQIALRFLDQRCCHDSLLSVEFVDSLTVRVHFIGSVSCGFPHCRPDTLATVQLGPFGRGRKSLQIEYTWFQPTGVDTLTAIFYRDSLVFIVGCPPPQPLQVAFEALGANPVRNGRPAVEFTLADAAPPRLALLDIAGREIASLDVGTLGAGSHVAVFGDQRLRPGIYLAHLTHLRQVL